MRKGSDPFEDIPANTILRWVKTLGDIGGRRRSEGAWPKIVRFALERMVIFGGSKYVDSLACEDLPYACMTTATIAAMLLYAPHSAGLVKDKLKSRLPLEMSESDEDALNNFYPGVVFSVPVLKATSELFDGRAKVIFFRTGLMSMLRTDISWALDTSRRTALWSSVSQSHIALFAENLPEGSASLAFCRLCLGQKPMSLSGDTSLIAAFFSAPPERKHFHAALSLFLMTWQGISVEFLLWLFERSFDEHELINAWETLPKMISKIQSPDDRKSVARGISLILKSRYRNNMREDMRLAVKALNALEKSGKLPEDNDDEYSDWDDFDRDFLRSFERFARKRKLF